MEEHLIPEDELIQVRVEKLEKMRAMGKDPFAIEKYSTYARIEHPDGTSEKVNPHSEDVISAYEKAEPKESSEQPPARVVVNLAGRIVSLRLMGKASFAHIQDRKGKVQVYMKADDLAEQYEMVKLLDLGDFIGVKGYMFRTRTGEISVHAEELTVLSKSIRPIPLRQGKGRPALVWAAGCRAKIPAEICRPYHQYRKPRNI